MTAPPSLAASSRDALATALDAILARCHPVDAPSPMSLQDADALIRSGTVLDLAALADDDALVERVAKALLSYVPAANWSRDAVSVIAARAALAAVSAAPEGGDD